MTSRQEESEDLSTEPEGWRARLQGVRSDDRAAIRQVVRALNRRTGAGLRWLETAELGETGGAAFVVWPDGRSSVVTTATVSATAMHRTAEALELARAAGCPVPAQELIVELEDQVVAVVQERLPGEPPVWVDADLVDRVVAANERFGDLLVDRPDLRLPHVDLARGFRSSFSEPLEQYSDRSRRLLRECRQLDPSPRQAPADDLVHLDLTVSNVLLEDGRITGIVDWNNGAFRGDRHLALVKLLFDLTWVAAAPDGIRHHVQASALDRLDTVVYDTIDPARLRSYWAYWTVTMLQWTIRTADPETIELHVALGERGLG